MIKMMMNEKERRAIKLLVDALSIVVKSNKFACFDDELWDIVNDAYEMGLKASPTEV